MNTWIGYQNKNSRIETNFEKKGSINYWICSKVKFYNLVLKHYYPIILTYPQTHYSLLTLHPTILHQSIKPGLTA